MEIKTCRRCGEVPIITLSSEGKCYSTLKCKCTSLSMPNDPTGEKVVDWWTNLRYPPKITNLEWIKMDATADQIVDFFSQVCTPQAMASYCEQFDNCHDCKVAWLNSKMED